MSQHAVWIHLQRLVHVLGGEGVTFVMQIQSPRPSSVPLPLSAHVVAVPMAGRVPALLSFAHLQACLSFSVQIDDRSLGRVMGFYSG